ncbi:hypothetical protein RGUI_4124 [Rhodovulum sp. P5]|nr:hypothetical protein RGUI_4124 [Rhodovulum sp. P5]
MIPGNNLLDEGLWYISGPAQFIDAGSYETASRMIDVYVPTAEIGGTPSGEYASAWTAPFAVAPKHLLCRGWPMAGIGPAPWARPGSTSISTTVRARPRTRTCRSRRSTASPSAVCRRSNALPRSCRPRRCHAYAHPVARGAAMPAATSTAGSKPTTCFARPATDDRLIVDGAVTAEKISVLSLDAISADLGSIEVGTANIADAAITSAKDRQRDPVGRISYPARPAGRSPWTGPPNSTA